MVRYSFKELRRKLAPIPDAWLQTLKHGKIDPTQLWIDLPNDFKFPEGTALSPAPAVKETRKRERPLTREEFPIWAKALAKKAISTDKGIGDVIERIVGPFGGDAFKAWYSKTIGKSCGCAERQEKLNWKYPLSAA